MILSQFPRPTLRIATRASQLALWQSRYIADLIRHAAPEVAVELVHVSTTGDRDQSETLRALGSFGVFTREVQLAILDGRADLAVHSLKDLPTDGPPQLTLAATPVRGLTYDALILPAGKPHCGSIRELVAGARVGTGSPRRQAQLRYLRPDLQLSEIRGNVDTRLRKLDTGEYDALILAAAGLTRLGLSDRIHTGIAPPDMYPAVGQGAVGVECRTDDADLRTLLALITDAPTLAAVTAERSLLSSLRAGCHAPLGVQTRVDGDTLDLEAVVLSLDGQHRWMASASANVAQANEIGRQVADLLTAQGVDQVLRGVV
jgi:hydroxymethylbilane synthase